MTSLGILLLVLAVAVCAEEEEERLFEANVIFKHNSSSNLLEISFDREDLFSVLTQLELTTLQTYQCLLKENGSDRGHFVQNGPDDVAPFTIIKHHDMCKPMKNRSIRCEIKLFGVDSSSTTVNVKSKEFSYEGSQDLLDYRCDMTVFYAVTIGNRETFENQFCARSMNPILNPRWRHS